MALVGSDSSAYSVRLITILACNHTKTLAGSQEIGTSCIYARRGKRNLMTLYELRCSIKTDKMSNI